MKEPMVITMAREYASGGSEIAQAVADKLGIPLYNKELITLAAKKSGLTEEAIAASENQRSGSLIYSLYMMGNTMPLADQVYILQSNVIKELAAEAPASFWAAAVTTSCVSAPMCCAPSSTRRWRPASSLPRAAPTPRTCRTACGRPSWPSMTVPAQATTITIPKTAGARPRTTTFA